jgi:Flp pilus assembly pilin Flp
MLTKFGTLLSNLRRDQRGLTTVEYVIVLCLIAAMAVGTWKIFGKSINTHLGEAQEKLDSNIVVDP